MISTDPEFESFSYAALDPAGRNRLRAKLIIEAAKVYTASFRRRCGQQVALASAGLTAVLSGWYDSEATIDEAMRLPLALQTIRNADADPVWIAALSAAHLHNLGRPGEWSASFAAPAPLAFGCYITPSAKDISVTADAGRIVVRLDGGALTEVSSFPNRMQTADIGHARAPILNATTQRIFPIDDHVGFAEVPAQDVAWTLAGAASILRRNASGYLSWVEEAVSAVVPIPPYEGKATQSFSVQGLNGIVFASFPEPPLIIADILVHEASHQYFHYGQLDTLFTNGMDATLYPSPYVRKNRTIDRILIAFHAFANTLLFYRACLASGMVEDCELAEREIAFHLRHLGPMSSVLERSPGLTAVGRGLFEPLREELFR